MNTLAETVEKVIDLGYKKVHKDFIAKLMLGFIGGAMISFGYMAYVYVRGLIPGGVGVLLGASVFPIGLIVILLAGGELITGNMMVVGTAFFNKKVSLKELVLNWLTITFANLLGALTVSLLFGVYLGGLNEYKELVNTLAQGKVHYDPVRTLVSGIACNWFVGLSVWLSQSLKDGAGKILGIWFPVMIFVLLGFQHSVANMFLLSAGLAYEGVTFGAVIVNLLASYAGNIIGGAVFVGWFYTLGNRHK